MSPAPLIVYHGSCVDGFTSAWAAYNRFGFDALYLAQAYGEPFILPSEPRDVYVLDFAFDRATTEALIAFSEKHGTVFLVLDHHKSAFAALGDLTGHCRFDMDKSGARLAWEHFNHDQSVPPVVAYTEDLDLWRFQMPSSRAVNQWIGAQPHDFGHWDEVNRKLGTGPGLVITMGEAMLDQQQAQIDRLLRNVQRGWILGHEVPIVNTALLQSEVGEALYRKYPATPFSATYFDAADGQRVWSLRAPKNGFDVSEVAKRILHQGAWGGGHPGAAGFRTDRRNQASFGTGQVPVEVVLFA